MATEDDYYLNLNQDQESLLRSRSSLGSNAPHRQGSLVRPERNRFNNPENPHYYYVQKTQEQQDHLSVQPSTTGINPTRQSLRSSIRSQRSNRSRESDGEYPLQDFNSRDKDIDDVDDEPTRIKPSKKTLKREKDNSLTLWQLYCYAITFWAPGSLLALFGMPDKPRQMAWREKMALLSVIGYIGAIVAYLTFGFTRTVCSTQKLRLEINDISVAYVTVNGKAYQLNASLSEGSDFEVKNDTMCGPWTAGGKDISFLYQNVNGNCHNIIKPKDDCDIPHDDDNNLAWYFPCKQINQDGSSKPNFTIDNYAGWGCHTNEDERKAFYDLDSVADIYFSWDDIKNSSRNLVVYNGHVLDLDLLDWLEKDQLDYPPLFDDLRDSNLQGYDLSVILSNGHERKIARCLSEIIKVGEVDSKTVGCIASDVVLYVSLVFILSVVVAKFLVACYFRWFVSRKQGASEVDNKTMDKHLNAIEDWSENIGTQGPINQVSPNLRPKKYSRMHKSCLLYTSRCV